jgi:hypothetical protein
MVRSFQNNYRFLASLVIVLGAWIPIELAVAWYLRRNKILESRSGGVPSAKQGD